MNPELSATLTPVAQAAEGLRDDWWIIGSAAMALHGLRGLDVADVDLLVSPDDARRLAARWGVAPRPPSPSPRFRSEVYFQWSGASMPVDVMGGFQVLSLQGWRPLVPRTRTAVGGLFTPELAEQIDILELFGRPKDLERAQALRVLIPPL
ncbi:hypothetical protein [Phenylobacterium sp.]|uniref:hypothetical protein n=1 Tax=Phenylobacterium sp. TaxID=1871053 RepID=UPI002F920296